MGKIIFLMSVDHLIVIETKRLILRTWDNNDINNYYLLNQDPKRT